MHDERYKTLFAFPRMVEDLVRGFAAREQADALDFSTLRKVPTEYVSDARLIRRSDVVWRMRFRDGRHLLLMLEFQSREESRMALRFLVYVSLLYQELARNQAPVLDSQGRLPLVLPVVLYNGNTPWTAARQVEELIQPADGPLASNRPSQRHHLVDERHVAVDDLPQSNLVTAVVCLEQSRSEADLAAVAGMLQRCLPSPEDAELRQVFADWMRETVRRLLPEGEHLPVRMTLEEVEMTLVERVGEWPKQWMREGIEQGLAHERALLRRQAYARFGSDTAQRLEEVLAGIADPERLAEVGEWLVRCDTGNELLARLTLTGTETGRDDP